MCLMVINAVFFGWKFMEGSSPQTQVKEKVLPQAGARIQLLSESKLPRQPAAEAAMEAPAPGEGAVAAVEPAEVRQCFNVGPFAADQDARAFSNSVRAKRFTARVDKRKVDVKDYWVFIPALINRMKAEEKLRDLKSRGIQGFIVKDGMFVNAISLNHFKQKDLAQAFLAKMQEAGVTAEFRELTSVGVQPWVYVSPAQSGADLRAEVDGYLASHPDVKREITACED